MDKDLKRLKGLLKKKKSFKEQYEERVKEKARSDEEQIYKAKLETLDKLEFGEGVEGKLKKGAKKLKELIE